MQQLKSNHKKNLSCQLLEPLLSLPGEAHHLIHFILTLFDACFYDKILRKLKDINLRGNICIAKLLPKWLICGEKLEVGSQKKTKVRSIILQDNLDLIHFLVLLFCYSVYYSVYFL